MEYSDDLYKNAITATIGDIYYATGMSSKVRIHSLRYLTELYVRKLTKCNTKEEVQLGDNTTKTSLREAGVKEDFFWRAYKIIQKNGNDRSHTQVYILPTEEDFEKVARAVVTIQAYLFYDFFKKYPFGSNPKIERNFSFLPPYFRLEVLKELIFLDPNNPEIIHKYGLTAIKTLGKENALQEIDKHKKRFSTLSMPFDSNYAKQILETGGLYVYAQTLQFMSNFSSVYDYLTYLINTTGDTFDRIKLPYTTFEGAKAYYLSEGKVDGDTPDVIEFNSLMDYIYTGRKPVSKEA